MLQGRDGLFIHGLTVLSKSDCVSHGCFTLYRQQSFSQKKQVWTYSVSDENRFRLVLGDCICEMKRVIDFGQQGIKT